MFGGVQGESGKSRNSVVGADHPAVVGGAGEERVLGGGWKATN